MGYLVAKIIVLLVLAAALGFWLAHWWLRRRYQDVTEEYARLLDASAAGADTTGEGIRRIEERLAGLEGVEGRLGAAFGERLSALERTILPPLSDLADLGPVSRRLEALESAVAGLGVPDLDPIEARLAGLASIDGRLSALERQLGALATPRAPDFSPVTQRLESLAAAIGDRMLSFEDRLGSLAPEPADLGPVTQRLESLAAGIGDRMLSFEDRLGSLAPESTDLGPLTRRLDSLATVIAERMATLEQRVGSSGREPVDLGPLAERLEAVETAVAGISVPDLRPLEVRLGVLGAIADRLEAMSHSVERLTPAPVDLSPVNRRIEALAGAVGDRLSSLEQVLVSREPRPADLGPIEARLDAITDRIHALGSPAEGAAAPTPDLGWVHERLHGLEQQLGALRGLLEGMTARSVPTVGLAGSRNLLRRPVYGPPDDLKRIRGIGFALEKLLHRIGVYYFWQVAEWDQSDVRFVDAHLEIFKGRIERDRWVEQAQEFAGEPGSAAKPDSLEPPPGDAGQ